MRLLVREHIRAYTGSYMLPNWLAEREKMEDRQHPWWLTQVTEDIALELWTGEEPHLVVATQDSRRVRIELADVRKLTASLREGAAYLAVAVASGQPELLELLEGKR